MSPFTVFVLCIQACLIQVALSQRACSNNLGLSSINLAPTVVSSNLGLATGSVTSSSCGYGGAGTGQVTAIGDVSACGETVMVGSIPAIGQASFGGALPGTGSVSIAGQCGCGCA